MSDDYGLGNVFRLLFIALPFAVLGAWKLVEILVWIIQHVILIVR